MTQPGLTQEQADCINNAFEELLAAVRAHVGGGRLTKDMKRVVKKGRVVGFKLRCEVKPPGGKGSLEWLNKVTACVAGLTGYGEVKAIMEDGEVVGGCVEISHDLSRL